MFKDNNKGRLLEEPYATISSFEASTATAVQFEQGVEEGGGIEGKRDSLGSN